MAAEEILLDLKNLDLPDAETMRLSDVINIYETFADNAKATQCNANASITPG